MRKWNSSFILPSQPLFFLCFLEGTLNISEVIHIPYTPGSSCWFIGKLTPLAMFSVIHSWISDMLECNFNSELHIFWRETFSKQGPKKAHLRKQSRSLWPLQSGIQNCMNVDASLNKTEFIKTKLWIEPLNISWCLEENLPGYDLANREEKGSLWNQFIKSLS